MDIAEPQSAEEALRETQAALEFILKAAQVGDWDLDLVHDTSRRSLRHDQCFGYQAPIAEADWGIEVFIGHVHPEDRAAVENSLRHAIGELLDWDTEFRVIWPDGSLHWIAARGSIYRSSAGVATRMLGVVMDITGHKRTEEARSASERLARGQVEALTRAVDAMAMEVSPDRLAEHVLRTITERLQAHSISVWRRDEPSGLIGFEYSFENDRIVANTDPRFAGMSPWLPSGGYGRWPQVFRTGKPDLLDDIRILPPFSLKDRLVGMGIISVLMVPMSISGRLEGAIGIRFTRHYVPREEELALAQALANQAMLAMQLTRLSAQSRDAAVLAERNRMAREIHDTLAQGFTGVIVQLEAAADARARGLAGDADAHLGRASGLARESLREARRSVLALRPQALEEQALSAALETLLEKMTAGTPLRAEFVLQGEPWPLPPVWEENLLRIGQEALTNALRHAQAGSVGVRIVFAPDQVRLELHDNGRGFDVTQKHQGFGLQGIVERVASMGGRLLIESTAATGTAISIALPLPADAGALA